MAEIVVEVPDVTSRRSSRLPSSVSCWAWTSPTRTNSPIGGQAISSTDSVLPFQEERDINMRRTSLIILIAAAGLWVAWAAKSVILHPEMTVESGTYDKPMATIGTKPDQAWSGTTTAAGVDNKPQPGKPVSMV